jgi:adenine deaminase
MNLLQKRMQSYAELIQAARGDIPVDLVIEGGRILNVLTGEILTGDIAVHKGFIVSLFTKTGRANQHIDARGKIAIPAFIDPHVHIESSMVLPPAYAEIVAANGTGTILSDPHEIVNVMGVAGFSLMIDNTENLPVRIFFDIPTCVPSKREAESSGADIQAAEIRKMARLGGRKLGELMSYEEIIANEPVMSEIVKTGWELGLPRDAHFPMFSVLGGVFNNLNLLQKLGVAVGMLGSQLLRWSALNALPFGIFMRQLRKQEYPELNAYLVALGLTADHETYGPEIQIKLDHGMHLMISSHIFLTLPQLMPIFLQGVRRLKYKDMIGLCTDDIWPDDLIKMGGIPGVLRHLVKNGIHPVDAVRFATLNNARRLAQAGIAEAALIGALVPGMAADIVLIDEPFKNFNIDLVIHEGKVIAENGKLTQPVPALKIPQNALDSVPVLPVTADTFRVPSPSQNGNGKVLARILALPKPPALPFPNLVEQEISVNGKFIDTSQYIMIAVFNRYGNAEKSPVIGLIQGYTLKEGATASTLSHDSHNLIVLGTNPEDMALACNTVIKMKGGMTAVRNQQVLAQIPFPVGGLMSQEPVEVMAQQAKDFRQAIGELGLDPKSPILPFAVFSLPAGPGDKVTDRGIWDSTKHRFVELLV